MAFRFPEEYRQKDPPGLVGAYKLPPLFGSRHIYCRTFVGHGWERVAAYVRDGRRPPAAPNYAELQYVHKTFWDPATDAVCQFWPPDSHRAHDLPNVVHLWRPTHFGLALPEPLLLGPTPDITPEEAGELAAAIPPEIGCYCYVASPTALARPDAAASLAVVPLHSLPVNSALADIRRRNANNNNAEPRPVAVPSPDSGRPDTAPDVLPVPGVSQENGGADLC